MNAIDTLDHYFHDLEAEDRFSGVVFITRGKTILYSEAYGYASRTWKIRNTLDVRFDTASTTKLFTTAAVLQLIDRKSMALDTRVAGYLGLEGTKISSDVNVYHLLTNTSGIADDCEEEDGERYEDLWKTKPNYSVRNTEDFLPQFVYKEPNFPPGQSCRYCNCGFVLLGLMIEKASGMSYRDYIREHVFKKAGMSRSDFFDMGNVHEMVAEGADPIRNAEGEIKGWKKNIYAFPPIGFPRQRRPCHRRRPGPFPESSPAG
jgi:CubicO group peptidase (beta-lactamase class C family)